MARSLAQRPRNLAHLWLGALALLCAQVALAGHQYQHDAAAVADDCAACTQLQSLDAPPPTASSLEIEQPVPVAAPAPSQRPCVAPSTGPCRTRAPPRD